MRKLVGFAAACAAAVMMFTSVQARDLDYTGEWYGDFLGSVLHFSIYDDGTLISEFNGTGDTHTWVPTDAGLLLDRGVLLTMVDDDTLTTSLNGLTIVFTHEEPEIFDPGQIIFDAALEDFAGSWKIFKLGSGQTYLNPSDAAGAVDINITMDIADNKVTLDGFYWNNNTIEMDLMDGQLYAMYTEKENPFFSIIDVQLLNTGWARVYVQSYDGSPVFFIFARADEAVEEETNN